MQDCYITVSIQIHHACVETPPTYNANLSTVCESHKRGLEPIAGELGVTIIIT